MAWVFALVGVVLVASLALVLAGRLPPVPQPTSEPRTVALPPQPTAADIDALRLPVVFRGYRMEEVDAALAALRVRIAELESTTQTPRWTGAPDGRAQDAATDG
jgi:DivIVA domain-containing protein